MNTVAATAPNEIERQRVCLVLALRDHQIPEYMHGGILDYLLHGIVPGSFLLALLCNDIPAAQAKADPNNATAFKGWLEVLKVLPSSAWGHPRTVADWITRKGLHGRVGEVTPKQTPILPPASRPSPSVLLALSADVNKRVGDALKHLGEIVSRIPDGATSDGVRWAMNDLAVARTSCDAIAAECRKGAR